MPLSSPPEGEKKGNPDKKDDDIESACVSHMTVKLDIRRTEDMEADKVVPLGQYLQCSSPISEGRVRTKSQDMNLCNSCCLMTSMFT